MSESSTHFVDPNILVPHPHNPLLYGENEDISDLVELIGQSGWVKPLLVTPQNRIISGHRRSRAALQLGLKSVPVEVREFADELAELEALLLENAARLKTTEQKVREALAWKDIETQKAKKRMSEGGQKAAPGRLAVNKGVANLPHLSKTGKTRDAIAHRVGLGGRSYEKAAKVVELIDKETAVGNLSHAQVLRSVLNEKSIDAAYQLLKKPPEERAGIVSLMASGRAENISQALKVVKEHSHRGETLKGNDTTRLFSAGDIVEIRDICEEIPLRTENYRQYVGLQGQVEAVWHREALISVNLENGLSKIRFYPEELNLIRKAPPPLPYRVGDLIVVDVDRAEAATSAERKWNGFWGVVVSIGELGSLSVNVGKVELQLFPRDIKPIDAPSQELKNLAERVLRLRTFELDELEEKMLDFLQQHLGFTPRQMLYLDTCERTIFTQAPPAQLKL